MEFRLRILKALRSLLGGPTVTGREDKMRAKILGCGCGLFVAALLAIAIAAAASQCGSSKCSGGCPLRAAQQQQAAGDEELEADAASRMILSRGWFDKLPERPTDNFDLWIFFGGGIGLHEAGSRFRFNFDLFEFERAGSKLEGRYFQDKKQFKSSFTVKSCDGHEPFNLCLTIENMNGKKLELYGFGHDEEMEGAIPGSKARLAAAKALTESSKGN